MSCGGVVLNTCARLKTFQRATRNTSRLPGKLSPKQDFVLLLQCPSLLSVMFFSFLPSFPVNLSFRWFIDILESLHVPHSWNE